MAKTETKKVEWAHLEQSTAKIADIDVTGNVRVNFDKAKMDELAASVMKHGVLEPLLVRPNGKPGRFFLIAGERRLRAARELGLKEVPVRVLQVDENGAREIQAVENLQRADLGPIEEAEAYRTLLVSLGLEAGIFVHAPTKELDGKVLPNAGFDKAVAEAAARTGKPKAHVSRMLRLLELPAWVSELIKKGDLLVQHGWLYLTVPKEFRPELDAYVKEQIERRAKGYGGMDGAGRSDRTITVNAMEWFIDSKLKKDLKKAPFPTDKPWAGEIACSVCPFNTACQSTLFPTGEAGTCRQPKCWNKKREQTYRAIREELASRPEYKDLTFSGYGRMAPGYNGQDAYEKLKMPESISGFQVLPEKLPAELAAALKDGKLRKAFGWVVVKPQEDSEKPKVQVRYVVREPDLLPKSKAVKPKGEAKKSAQDSSSNNEEHAKLRKFFQEVTEILTSVESDKSLRVMSSNPRKVKDVLLSFFSDDDKRALPAISKTVNRKFPKFEDLKKASEETIALFLDLCWRVSYNGRRQLYEQVRQHHEKQLTKAFEEHKSKIEYANYDAKLPKGLASEVAQALMNLPAGQKEKK